MNDVLKPSSWWNIQKFGKLRLRDIRDLKTNSRDKSWFVCECGKQKNIIVRDVTSKKTQSCGQCNVEGQEYWESHKFGKLVLKTPKQLHIGSNQSEIWVCDCGKEKSIPVKDVTSGDIVSCAKCNEMPMEWWKNQTFGKLKLTHPRTLNKFSKKKTDFTCVCGYITNTSIYSVISGGSSSCGRCSKTIHEWFMSNKDALRSLRVPIEPESVPVGGPFPLETIRKVSYPFRAKCPHCRKEYSPRWSSIKLGKSLTCGCSSGVVSKTNLEIYDFLLSSGFEPELEYEMSGYRYDVHVRNCMALIEYQSERCHSSDKSVANDAKKASLANVYGYEIIQIQEKDWKKNKSLEKSKLARLLENRRGIGFSHRCKNEILARINELDEMSSMDLPKDIILKIQDKKEKLIREIKSANEDIISAAISSHHIICKVKNMKPNEAYGNDPFVYYGLGLVGEAGELSGALLRAIRSGGSEESKKAAVASELADCLIYAIILGYSTGIELVKIVNEKARIVGTRALAGYYGPPIRQ